MTISLKANAAGTQGEVLLNGTTVQTFNQNTLQVSGNVLAGAAQSSDPAALTRKDYVDGPAFSANKTTNQNSPGSSAGFTVLFENEVFDTAAGYNPATGIFQPNVAGYYQLNAMVNLNSDVLVTKSNLAILKNGIDVASSQSQSANGTYETHALSCLVYLNGTTDSVRVAANITGTMPLYVFATAGMLATFSGFLARGV